MQALEAARSGQKLSAEDRQVLQELAEWGEEEWQDADCVAAKVVAAIFSRQFWPPSYEPRALGDEFAPICQDLVAGRRLAQVAEGAAP